MARFQLWDNEYQQLVAVTTLIIIQIIQKVEEYVNTGFNVY